MYHAMTFFSKGGDLNKTSIFFNVDLTAAPWGCDGSSNRRHFHQTSRYSMDTWWIDEFNVARRFDKGDESVEKNPMVKEYEFVWTSQDGKGRKRNSCFDLTWTQAHTRQWVRSNSTNRERSTMITIRSACFGSTSIKNKSVANFLRTSALATRTSETPSKLVWAILAD
jgi:hypothetical protein